MNRALLRTVCVVVATVAVSAFGPARAIVTRHDRPDAAFLELAKRFPSTVTVKPATATGPGDAGTLIGPRWVMTAAHVAAHLEAGDIAVVGGENIRIDRIVRHPNWRTDADFRFDIALLELDRTVTAVSPAAIYTRSDELGRVITFVGRGGNGTGLTGPTAEDGQLRGATNRVEHAGGGLLRFRFDEPGSPGATDLEGISGPGDSGGPAYLVIGDTTFVLGVSSAQDSRPAGRQEGRYGVLEYYVRVSEYAEWIKSTTAENARRTNGPPSQAQVGGPDTVRIPVAGGSLDARAFGHVQGRPVALFYHQCSRSIDEWHAFARPLNVAGYNVLVVAPRGIGASVGPVWEYNGSERDALQYWRETWGPDVDSVASWVERRDGRSPQTVGGAGCGAFLALLAASRSGGAVRDAVLLSGFVDDSVATYLRTDSVRVFLASASADTMSLRAQRRIALLAGRDRAEATELQGAGHGLSLLRLAPDLPAHVTRWLTRGAADSK